MWIWRHRQLRFSRHVAIPLSKDDHGRQTGFTLIELLVVIILMVIFLMIILSVIRMSPSEGRSLYKRVQGVTLAVQHFDYDTGCYPANIAMLTTEPASAALGWPSLGGNLGQDNCSIDVEKWNGPYLSGEGVGSSGTNGLRIGSDITGQSNSLLQIQTGNWLDNTAEMQGRSPVEVALVVTNVKPTVQTSFCKRCGSCVTNGSSSGNSSCFIDNTSVGYVFATLQ